MNYSRRDFLRGSVIAGSILASRPLHSVANAAAPATNPLRIPLKPEQAPHLQWTGGCVFTPAPVVWNNVPADLHAVSVLGVHNEGNSIPAWRFEQFIHVCQQNGVGVAPEVVSYGGRHETMTPAWLEGVLRKYSS